MQFNLIFDASTAAAPAGFRDMLTQAAVELESKIDLSNQTVINVAVGWGEVAGDPLGDALAAAEPNGQMQTYAALVAGLTSVASSAADWASLAALPATDALSASGYYVSNAQLKAFGEIAADAPGLDGAIGFGVDYAQYVSALRLIYPNVLDMEGVAEHELSVILGRYSQALADPSVLGPVDLFRYAASGVRRDPAVGGGYFSTNGGATVAGSLSSVPGSADWSPDVYADIFGYAAYGAYMTVTSPDLAELDVLGYTPAGKTLSLGIAPGVNRLSDQDAGAPFNTPSVVLPDGVGAGTVTITLSDPANGVLVSTRPLSGDAARGVYTLTGDAATLTASLSAIRFVPTLHQVAPGQSVTTDVTVALSIPDGGHVATHGISVVTTAAAVPIVIGSYNSIGTTDDTPIYPFAGVTISDVNFGQVDHLTVRLSAPGNGTLTDLGAGAYDAAAGIYSVSGTAAEVTAALDALRFVPTPYQVAIGRIVSTVMPITVSDTAGLSTTEDGTGVSVLSIRRPVAPGLSGNAYGWATQAALSGATVAAVSQGVAGSVTLGAPRIDAAGTIQADFTAAGATALRLATLTLSLPGGTAARFTAAAGLPADWVVSADSSVAGQITLRAAGSTRLSGDVVLGHLALSPPSGAQSLSFAVSGNAANGADAAPYAIAYAATATDAGGAYALPSVPAGTYAMAMTRAAGDGGRAVTAADALAALKLSLGLEPNPVSATTGRAALASPYQFIAADANGDGRVTAADALAILRMSISGTSGGWVFATDSGTWWDPVAHGFTVNQAAVPTDLPLSVATDGRLNAVGILRGDVNASWAPADPVLGTTPNHIASLVLAWNSPPDEWGAPSYSAAAALTAGATVLSPVSVVDDAAAIGAVFDGLDRMAVAGTLAGIWVAGPSSVITLPDNIDIGSYAVKLVHGRVTYAPTGGNQMVDVGKTEGITGLDLSHDPVVARVELADNTVTVAGNVSGGAISFIGAPDVLTAGPGNMTVFYEFGAATGVLEFQAFKPVLDALDVVMDAATLTVRDVTLDGAAAVFLGSTAYPGQGIVMPGTLDAASLLASHVQPTYFGVSVT